MKSILCFIDSLGSGGAQRQLVNIAKLLQLDGYDVEFLVYFDAPFYEEALLESGIKITKIIEDNKILRVFRLAKYLIGSKANCVISFLDTPNFISNIAYCFPHKWRLLTNELSAEESSFVSKKGKILRSLRKKTDGLICNSHNAMAMWKKYYPDMDGLLSVIYNPLIIDEADDPSEEAVDDCDLLGKRQLLVAASFQQLKGPQRFVKAVSLLDEDYKSRLIVDWYGKNEISPGNSVVYDETKGMIAEYSLEDVVRLHDATQEIYSYMKKADAIGLFSDYEGLPNAICEGLYFKKPIIMTKVSDYAVLLGKENGILCESGDPEDIADALKLFLDMPKQNLIEAGMRGRSIADDTMRSDSVISQWVEAIGL